MRINKLFSNYGICSRKETNKLIEDKRVIVIDKPNEGVSKARNDALDIISGRYVYFLDPDDFIDRGWCEEMYLLACRYDVDILIFNFYSIVNGFKQKCLHNIPVIVRQLPFQDTPGKNPRPEKGA